MEMKLWEGRERGGVFYTCYVEYTKTGEESTPHRQRRLVTAEYRPKYPSVWVWMADS